MALTKISTDGVKDDAITKAKIPADQIEASELANNAVDTNAIQDDAVTEDKLANSINTAIAANTAKDLTALSASNLTSGTVPDARFPATLPAVSGANLTNLPAGGKVSNLVINGAMNVAQRGTSSTSNGYKTVDRITPYTDNIGVTPTYSQVDVTSGGAYDAGFRKAWQVTKGAGTTNTNSQVNMGYKIEAQDIASSGWKYTDPNSYITISFWLKTSVSNHNPQLLVLNQDQGSGSTKCYFVDISPLTANTWTKITCTIPGHANQVYNMDNGTGLEFQIIAWYGTDYTDAGNTPNTWTSFGTKPVDSTWLTTNNSTFQVTGILLEVGETASDYPHESYGDTLAKCQRYYEVHYQSSGTASMYSTGDGSMKYAHTWYFHQCKRAQASVALLGNYVFNTSGGAPLTLTGIFTSKNHAMFYSGSNMFRMLGSSQGASVKAEAEL